MRITAILVALNEAPFIEAALEAIYPFVDRILIQTGYDRSWNNQTVEPDATVPRILQFPDPAGKIALLVRRLPDEALARNSLMRMDSYDLNHRLHNTVGMQEQLRDFCAGADYYWILDGDEIYDPQTIPAMLSYLERRRPTALFVRGLTYFHSWNYVVDPSDDFFQPGFLRAGVLFWENRNIVLPKRYRLLLNKYTSAVGVDKWLADRLSTIQKLPESIAVFHHASYVGDDARIEKKIRLSVHYEDRMAQWYDSVWKAWTPAMHNFHPIYPHVYAGVRYIPTSELPPIIRDRTWPDNYIERLST